jgi:broad specificity phosphatase PhoE
MQTEITLVRHGENKPYVQGEPKHPGPGLTKKGFSQAKKTAIYLKNYKFDKIYCSDMARAMETAQEIKKYQTVKISCYHELAEASMIIFDKKPVDKEKFRSTMKQVNNALKLFRRILKEDKGKKILIVAHGNIIRSIIASSLGIDVIHAPSLHTVNCSISTLVFEKGKLIGVPNLCYARHNHKRGFKEDLEYFKERRAYFMSLGNRVM